MKSLAVCRQTAWQIGNTMKQRYLEPTQEAGMALFSRDIKGPVTMLNLLEFRPTADYSQNPELSDGATITGREAFQKYIRHTLPFLKQSGGQMTFASEGGNYFIGPQDERWDMVMLIRQNSLQDFMQFASNAEYLKGIGHKSAAICDSRLLPLLATDIAEK
ncbi:MAG: hypothetical protein ACI9WC_000385 [Arenicella sp.]|jgi:hypothetical protein